MYLSVNSKYPFRTKCNWCFLHHRTIQYSNYRTDCSSNK